MTLAVLGDVLRRNAAADPDKTAFVFGPERISFAGHLARAQRLARALLSNGVGLQDRVAVMSRNSRAFMEIYAAGEVSGVIVATVNFRLAAAEALRVIAVCRPRVVFFEARYAGIFRALAGTGQVEHFVAIGADPPEWAVSYEDFIASGDPDLSLPAPAGGDIMHLIFTSGSTGAPKGVMRSHRNELAVSACFADEIEITPEDRLLLMMPVFHVGHRFVQLGAHYRAAEVHVQAEFDPERVLDAIVRRRITITHLAPTMIKALLEVPGVETRDLSSLRAIVYSGAPMPLADLERGLAIFGRVFLQLYGMSEGCATTLRQREHGVETPDERRRLASVGRPAAGVELRIADALDHPVAPGEIGEVQLRAPTVMQGYWSDSAATVAALRGGWHHTGDMGRQDADGYVYLVDRVRDMIISGGENIYSREVEIALARHPLIEDVAVIGAPDAYWGESVLAIVVARDAALTGRAVIEHCRSVIASYKKPRSVVFVDELPRLASGKVDKVALRRTYGAGNSAID